MQTKIHNRALSILAFMAVCLMVFASCEKEPAELPDPEIFTKVNILYSAGHHDLSDYLEEDIDELAESSVRYWDNPNEALIVFSHTAESGYAPIEPEIIRVREKNGSAVYETLRQLPEETNSADPETFREVLTYIKDNFPAKEYNLIFSSHCSGYLPTGYLGNFNRFEKEYGKSGSYNRRRTGAAAYPVPEYSGPLTKAIGADYDGSSTRSREMELTEFADAIPMPLNAIIFDSCFMGGIEVAYELRGKCHFLVASQAEVLADGMIYTAMGRHIFGGKTDLIGLCDDYYRHYNSIVPAGNSGATISLIDCTMLDALAAVCNELFGTYGDAINNGKFYSQVQRFYRTERNRFFHGFYDLRDILVKAGCSTDELARLDEALGGCIMYKNATHEFLTQYDSWGGFLIKSHCGFSMYLPAHKGTYGNNYLNDYYKSLAWNKATGLVK